MSTKTPRSLLRRYQLFFVGLGIFCAAAIAVNLVVRQGPVHDATVESDIRSITEAINASITVQAATLPTSLTEVYGLSGGIKKRLRDYTYTVTGPYQYQICATFTAASEGRSGNRYYPLGTGDDPAVHGKGRQCFQYTVSSNSPLVPYAK